MTELEEIQKKQIAELEKEKFLLEVDNKRMRIQIADYELIIRKMFEKYEWEKNLKKIVIWEREYSFKK